MKYEQLKRNAEQVLPGVIGRANTRFAKPSEIAEDTETHYFESDSATAGKKYYGGIQLKKFASEVKPRVSRNDIKVYCGCHSYYFYFAWYNFEKDCHLGVKPEPYIDAAPKLNKDGEPRKKREPNNPRHLPGACKHIISFVEWLERHKIVWK